MKSADIQFDHLSIGAIPRVVGVVTDLASVEALAIAPVPTWDVIEMRLDLIGPDTAWTVAVDTLQRAGFPVLATLRLAAEGGNWTAADAAREPILMAALQRCAAVDIEQRSPLLPQIIEAARALDKPLVISYHDFDATPPVDDLREIVRNGAVYERGIVKLASHINSTTDIQRLEALLTDSPIPHPLCVIGMGEMGQATRIRFPQLGSCLAYGHLDASTAPGQLSCHTLHTALHAAS